MMIEITEEQMNQAWEAANEDFLSPIDVGYQRYTLSKIGIFKCELCNGTGVIPNGSDISPCSQQCYSCHGNKWVHNAE